MQPQNARELIRGKPSLSEALLATGAVVPTLTLTDCEAELPTCIDDGTLQVGARETAGVIAQVKFTVPVKELDGESSRTKLASCPAATV